MINYDLKEKGLYISDGSGVEVEKISDVYWTKGKILVVDDMLIHLETAKLYLETSGYRVLCAPDIKAAWQLVIDEEPDLILLDVVMPGESGLDLLSDIRSRCPHTSVVVMTSYGNEDIAAAAFKLGATDYIKKPFKYSGLSQIIEKALIKQNQIKDKEKALKSLEYAYENLKLSADSVLQCMSAGVLAVNSSLCIEMLNHMASKILGVEKQNIIGRNIYEVFPVLNNFNLLKNTLKSGKGYSLHQVELPGEYGNVFLNINTDVIYDFHGNIIGAVAVFDDVTELRRKEALLRDRERLAIIGQMAAGMAHELKNPLTSLKGFAQILSSRSLEPDVSKYIKVMTGETDRMNQVIQDFLRLAKPKPPEFRVISINSLVEEIISIIEPQALLKDISVRIATGDYIPGAQMDPSQIKQVLLNLFQNSLESMENGGELSIQTKYLADQKEIRLDIKDDGCGIPAEIINKLGVPFYTTKAQGTGLGLCISFAIVEQHKGRVEIQSREGMGTVFSILLPVS